MFQILHLLYTESPQWDELSLLLMNLSFGRDWLAVISVPIP